MIANTVDTLFNYLKIKTKFIVHEIRAGNQSSSETNVRRTSKQETILYNYLSYFIYVTFVYLHCQLLTKCIHFYEYHYNYNYILMICIAHILVNGIWRIQSNICFCYYLWNSFEGPFYFHLYLDIFFIIYLFTNYFSIVIGIVYECFL